MRGVDGDIVAAAARRLSRGERVMVDRGVCVSISLSRRCCCCCCCRCARLLLPLLPLPPCSRLLSLHVSSAGDGMVRGERGEVGEGLQIVDGGGDCLLRSGPLCFSLARCRYSFFLVVGTTMVVRLQLHPTSPSISSRPDPCPPSHRGGGRR